jgi:hypothetical protein
MPYTYKSLAFAWLIIFALFAVSASGAARGWWFVLLLALAAVPALVLRSPVDVATGSPERPSVLADERERSPLDLAGIDVLQWENEGGAPGMRLRDRFRKPVTAA